MAMQLITSRIGKTLLNIVSVFAPTLSNAAQAGEDMGQAATATGAPSKVRATVLLEHRLSELITTSGQATVVSQPDALRVDLGVEVRARMLTQARDELATKVEQLTQAMKALGRENLTMQTSEIRISPLYDESEEAQLPRIVGYRARNTMTITLEDVDPAKVGAEAVVIVDTGVDAGANIVEGLSFFLSHPEQARERALKLAVADAERSAKTMAEAAGLRIDAVHDVNGTPERPMPIMFSDELALRASLKIEPGEVTTTANVTVRYHFTRP